MTQDHHSDVITKAAALLQDIPDPMMRKYLTALERNYPGASIKPLPSGAWMVTVPMRVAGGWSSDGVDVVLVAPVGFPAASPAHFYTTQEFRLASGMTPYLTSIQWGPDGATPMRRWLWKPEEWSPNRHGLVTFARQIERRFLDYREDERW